MFFAQIPSPLPSPIKRQSIVQPFRAVPQKSSPFKGEDLGKDEAANPPQLNPLSQGEGALSPPRLPRPDKSGLAMTNGKGTRKNLLSSHVNLL